MSEAFDSGMPEIDILPTEYFSADIGLETIAATLCSTYLPGKSKETFYYGRPLNAEGELVAALPP
jgi:hypothetical protein